MQKNPQEGAGFGAMFEADALPLWLGEAGHGAATLMHAAPEGFWTLRKVSPAVNSNRATGPELIEPWDG